MRTSPRFLLAFSLVLLPSAVGCSSTTQDPQPAPPPVKPAATPATTSDLSIQVYESSSVTPGGAALAKARVALSNAGGIVAEADADATGAARFAAVDWTKGPYGFTAYAAGHFIQSRIGLVQSDADVVAYLSKIEPSSLVALTGNITGLQGVANEAVTITASVPSTSFQAASTAYDITVAPDRPFQLIALDWRGGYEATSLRAESFSARAVTQTFLKWVVVDHPAVSGATTVDIDFATAKALTPTKVSGTIKIPGGATGHLGTTSSYGYFTVRTVESGQSAFLGAANLSDVNATNDAFDFVGEHVSLGASSTPVTLYMVYTATEGTYAYASGAPTDGVTVDDLYDVPVITAPPSGKSQSIYAPITLDAAPDGAVLRLVVAGANDLYWTLEVPAGTRAISLPPLPSTVTAATVLGKAPKARVLFHDAALLPNINQYRRSASSRTFTLTP